MLDIRFVRENAATVQEKSQQKGYTVDVAHVLSLDESRRELQVKADTLRQERNELAAGFKTTKPTPEQIERGKELKTMLAELDDHLRVLEAEFAAAFKKIPNMPLPEVPIGASEDDNIVVKTVGEKPQFDFAPKNHWQLAEAKGWIDKDRAAKVAGSRFAYLKGDMVLLERAMMQFALDQVTDEVLIGRLIADNNLQLRSTPFVPVLPPYMIKTAIYDAMDRLEPSDDRYKIDGEELWLQGSAEHVLGSMHADEIFAEAALPIRYAGYATSFRKEAGTYGKDMAGIIRMHQFNKLELETISTPETAQDEHRLHIALQEHIMQMLGLPYQLIKKCTADIGKPNAAGTDIDVWLPGQDAYRETHTADYMTDYQARRLQTRVRRATGDVELVHMNDATAITQRPLIAILENYQTKEGDVIIPKVLQPYMNGRTRI